MIRKGLFDVTALASMLAVSSCLAAPLSVAVADEPLADAASDTAAPDAVVIVEDEAFYAEEESPEPFSSEDSGDYAVQVESSSLDDEGATPCDDSLSEDAFVEATYVEPADDEYASIEGAAGSDSAAGATEEVVDGSDVVDAVEQDGLEPVGASASDDQGDVAAISDDQLEAAETLADEPMMEDGGASEGDVACIEDSGEDADSALDDPEPASDEPDAASDEADVAECLEAEEGEVPAEDGAPATDDAEAGVASTDSDGLGEADEKAAGEDADDKDGEAGADAAKDDAKDEKAKAADGKADADKDKTASDKDKAEEEAMSVALEAPKNSWVTEDGKRYYYDGTGKKVTGTRTINGVTYYFDKETGELIRKKFVLVSGSKTMYFDGSGKAQYGEKKIYGYQYYFDPSSGARADSKFVYQEAEKKTTYHDSLGHALYGQQQIAGSWYYLEPKTGARAEDKFVTHSSQSKTVYYDASGKMRYGETKVGSNWYYFEHGSGKMIENQFYYVPPASGQRSGKIIYLKPGGVEARGTYSIGGTKCNFNTGTGALESSKFISYFTNAGMLNIAQGYSSATGNLILVNRNSHVVSIYSGWQGNWTEVRSMLCGDGAPATPTPTGVFSIGDKGYFFDSGRNRCFYYSQIYGDYLFHSVLYAQTSTPQWINDPALGVPVSHGCVRLALENAYYIYSQIPRGTRVVIY